MNIVSIPFVAKVGIVQTEEGVMKLPFTESVQNHLNGVHASAQFTLAETASGEALQRLFPELAGKVVPLLREAQIRFRKPAASAVFAFPAVTEQEMTRFLEQLAKKRRATITVEVEVRDSEGTVTSTGTFEWFVLAEPH